MSDPRGTGWSDPTEADAHGATSDPAYSGQYWAPPTYPAGYGAPVTSPMTGPATGPATGQMPTYWQPGAGYPGGPPPPPPPPKSPRWLWIAAAAAVLLVTALVIALVIVSTSTKDSTMVAPLPQTSAPTSVPTQSPIPLPLPLPTATERPAPTTAPGPQTPANPAATETVVYSVTGDGRAINITYVDTGGVMQTEFNVALPWRREVKLAEPAKNSASVAVVNVGRDVTCSVTIDGAQVRQRSGRGLTICAGAG